MDTHTDQARTRVQAEQEAVDAKLDAFDSFTDRIADLSTDPTPSSPGITATAGAQPHVDASTDDHCRAVRTAFAETIRPHSVADVDGSESLLETIREEFTDTIALALAPTTEASFTPELKQMIIAETETRRAETVALREALGREKTHLEEASAVVDDITAWIAEVNEIPLSDLGFETLEHRHEMLASHRDRCEEVARQRQEFRQRTTNNGIEAGVRHQRLIQYLYAEFPVDHPVLATIARLDDTCSECQRAVRAHLVRRA